MSQSSSSVAFPRFASWVGVMAASTAFAGLAVPSSPTHAQAVGGMGQRSNTNSNTPQSSGPLAIQSQVYTPSRSVSPQQQRQSYPQPQPVYPHTYSNGNAPVFQSPAPGFFRHGPVGGPFPGSAPPPSAASQLPIVPPSVTYHRYGGIGAQMGSGYQPNDTNRDIQGGRVVTGRRVFRPGGVASDNNAPVFEYGGERSIRVTTPVGPRPLPSQQYNNNYIYSPVTIVNGPSLLGGYYYGNYSDTYYANTYCYPSVYSCYPGFPEYIVNPGVIVVGNPYYPAYETSYLPFSPPTYQVTYNQTNYYVASPERVAQIEDGGQTAHRALQNAYPEGTYQAAFGDIQKAWQNSDIGLLRKHIRDTDTKMSVYFKGKYSYSIASGDFVQITRDAFDRLSTVSFEFTRLRKAKNGDVTAYGKHVYKTGGSSDVSGDSDTTSDTVPFSTDGSQSNNGGSQPYDRADDPAAGREKTIYTSYTLRKHDDQWYIIGVDSSPTDLVK